MKRKEFVLLIVLMLLCIGAACAEDDFSAYEIQMGNAFAVFAPDAIMDNGDMLFRAWADREGTVDEDHPWHLVWMRDGQVYRDLPYAHDARHPWSASSFIPVNDECYVLLPPVTSRTPEEIGDQEYVPAVEVYHWTENGMELITSIPGQWDRQNIKVAQEGFIIYDKDNGDLHSYRYDGTLLSSCHLYDGEQDYLLRYSASKDGTQFVTISTSGYPHPSCILYGVKDGQLLWQHDYRWTVSTVCPGDGFVYAMWREKDDVLSPIRIERMDPMTGKVLISRTLSANKLILAFSLKSDPVSGKLVIFGRGVARSRNEYNAFIMVLDDNMKEISLDVRRFCYYQGDYFSVMNLPNGSFAVYANGTYEDDVDREPNEQMPPSGNPVIVPFEVLPEADRNGIKIK